MPLPNLLDRRTYLSFLAASELAEAERVFELGPGLGPVARRALASWPSIRLWILAEASQRLCQRLEKSIADADRRAVLYHVTENPPFPFAESSFDRFISCFVLDCMDRDTQIEYVYEARRLLAPGGLFCTMSVTTGETTLSKLTMGLGNYAARISPTLALGARFIELEPSFAPEHWRVVTNRTVINAGCATRLLILQRT